MEEWSGRTVAIKTCERAFDSPVEARYAYREVAILEAVRGQDNFVQLKDIIVPSERNEGVRGFTLNIYSQFC